MIEQKQNPFCDYLASHLRPISIYCALTGELCRATDNGREGTYDIEHAKTCVGYDLPTILGKIVSRVHLKRKVANIENINSEELHGLKVKFKESQKATKK